ncbi:hypothetical protein GEMRC1_007419 [Eukaryota sp. GEM-RC1]
MTRNGQLLVLLISFSFIMDFHLLLLFLFLSFTYAEVFSTHFDFLPVLVASFNSSDSGKSYNWDGKCFHDNTMSFEFDHKASKLVVSVVSTHSRSATCLDSYVVLTQFGLHVRQNFFRGHHTWHFHLSPSEFHDALIYGVHIFNVNQSMIHFAKDIYHTARLFMGRGTEKENIEFLEERLKINLKPRTIEPLAFDKNLLKPGDVILESDGGSAITTMISYGTGAFAGHCGIVLDIGGVLHIAESTFQADDKEFKPRRGFTATPFDQWIREETTIEYEMAVLLPLREDLSKNLIIQLLLTGLKEMKALRMDFTTLYFLLLTPNMITGQILLHGK